MKELAKKYDELKAQEKAITDELKELQGEIKDYLNDNELTTLDYDGGKLDYRTSEKVTVDEDALIKFIQQRHLEALLTDDPVAERFDNCIRHVPSIEESEVEELLYDGIITIEDIAHCYHTKYTKSLYVKRDKKGTK